MQTNTEFGVVDGAGSTGRDLRSALAKANQAGGVADEKARSAKTILDRADALLRDAQDKVRELESEAKAAGLRAIKKDAGSIAHALRSGAPAPVSAPVETGHSAELTAARAKLAAVEEEHGELAAEYDALKAEAIAAAALVREIIDRIRDEEARQIAAEMVAARELYWRLEDRLSGLLLIDDARPGGPRLLQLQAEILQKIDRRKREAAKNPLLLEEHRWREYLDELEATSERQWQDFAKRLESDANATFGGANGEAEH